MAASVSGFHHYGETGKGTLQGCEVCEVEEEPDHHCYLQS